MGDDKLNYEEDPRSPAIYLLDSKILLNSIISDANKGSRYCTADINFFYLNNPMKTYRYMKITIHLFTYEILKEYDINKLLCKGYVYVEIKKVIHGLKEAEILAYTALVNPSNHTDTTLYATTQGYGAAKQQI